MPDLVLDATFAVAAWLILIGVIKSFSRGQYDSPVRAQRLLLLGFGILLAGGIAHIVDRFAVASPSDGNLIEDIVVACATMLAGGGIVWVVLRHVRQEKSWTSPGTAQQPIRPAEQTAKELFDGFLKSSLGGVMVLKSIRSDDDVIVDFECVLLNAAAEQLLGRPASEIRDKPLRETLPCLHAEGLFEEGLSAVETGLPIKTERSINYRHTSGWFLIGAGKLGDGLAVTFNDITAHKKAEAELRYAAQHDRLTGLPNRACFIERMERAIGRSKRVRDYRFAVLYLDFDRFKVINDSLGHAVGDQLLISIAERLRSNLRAIDTPSRKGEEHVPARLGGDEFVILLDGVNTVADAVAVAERLQKELAVPHQLEDHEVVSTASIGIVLGDGSHDLPDNILRDADTAMYRAKTTGKARHVIFDDHMHKEAVQRLELERELRRAVDDQEFELVYEPVVDVATGQVAGLETLIRWPHPERGIVTPTEFFNVAEELGLIVTIGDWIITQACETFRRWRKLFPHHEDLSLYINLSTQQFVLGDFMETLKGVLADTRIDPACLRLAITENMLTDKRAGIARDIGRLKALGVPLVLDDFGAGHSSLSCIQNAPLDVLKLHRSVFNIQKSDDKYLAIIKAMVDLAHNLDMEVVVEGVETPAQLALITSLKCQYAQGPLFSPPLAVEAIDELLATRGRLAPAA